MEIDIPGFLQQAPVKPDHVQLVVKCIPYRRSLLQAGEFIGGTRRKLSKHIRLSNTIRDDVFHGQNSKVLSVLQNNLPGFRAPIHWARCNSFHTDPQFRMH